MKVSVDSISEDEIEEVKEAARAGDIPEASADEAKAVLLRAKEVVLSDQVATFAAKELGMTPEEFVAAMLRGFGATQ